MKNLENIIQLHKLYWERKNNMPLISYKIGSIFPANHFSISKKLLSQKKEVTPDMLNVEEFLHDYEKMYDESANDFFDDSIWTADPYPPIPWVEAMLGCKVISMDNGFISVPCIDSPEKLEELRIDFEGSWAKKYAEFLVALDELSKGRFPIGQPILRGLLDCLGAVIGQTQAIYALYDNEKEVSTFLNNLTEDFLSLIEFHYAHITPFRGGSSFFSIWVPGKCLKYQDDLTSLASPWIFERYLRINHEKMCSKYSYSAIHLHPTSFLILDNLLSVEELGAIQIQKDFGGPTIIDILPQIKKILKIKRVFLSGDFTTEEIDCVFEELPPGGLMLHVIKDTLEEATYISNHIKRKVID